MLVVLMLLLIPIMQLGFSYYASISTVLLILVLSRWGTTLGHGAAQANLLLAIVLLMGLPLMTAPSLDFNADLLRTLREGVMFLILASALVAFRTTTALPGQATGQGQDQTEPPLWVFVMLVGLFLILSLIQSVLLPRGIYFGFPEAYFSQEVGTIADEAALLADPESLRPQATFSEPSYLAFVLLSLSMMLIPRAATSRAVTVLMGVIVMVGLMSRSLAFLLTMAGVILFPLLLDKRAKRGTIIVGTVVAGTLMLTLTSASILITRLTNARSVATTDYSTLARIGRPLEVIPRFLEEYPLGVPLSALLRAMAPFMPDTSMEPGEILQNAVFNLIFLYGLSGLVLFGALLLLAKDLRTRLYIASCAMFNGAFLAIDKVAMIVMTIALYEQAKRLAQERLDRRDAVEPAASRGPIRYRSTSLRSAGR